MPKVAQVVPMIGLFGATLGLNSVRATARQQLHRAGRSCISKSLPQSLRGSCIPSKHSARRRRLRIGSKQCHAMGHHSLQVHAVWRSLGPCLMQRTRTSFASSTKGKCSQRSTQLFAISAISHQLGQVRSFVYVQSTFTEICCGSLLDQA